MSLYHTDGVDSMLKHWEHTEYISTEEYDSFTQLGTELKPTVSIGYNTALYVEAPDRKRVECVYDARIKGIRLIKGKGPNRDLRLYYDAVNNEDITILAVDGLTGTGKTSTTMEYLIKKNLRDVDISEQSFNYSLDGTTDERKPSDRKIIISKPMVNAGGEEYGFLPGDINEKLVPTITNFTQYFDRYHPAGFTLLREAGFVEIAPLGFIRGRDVEDTDLVVDECQNTKELITMATRRAQGTRMFFLGDTTVFQIDREGNTPEKNGLADLISLLNGAPYFMYIEMKTLEHVVRSNEVKDIMRRLFKKHGENPREWII